MPFDLLLHVSDETNAVPSGKRVSTAVAPMIRVLCAFIFCRADGKQVSTLLRIIHLPGAV